MNAALALPEVPFCMRFTFEDAAACWPVVQPLLQRACDHSGGRYAPEHVMRAIQSGEMVCFGAAEGKDLRAIVLCADVTWPTGLRIAEVVLMGASEDGALTGDVWACLIDGVMGWAMSVGADRLAASARRGFERRLKDLNMRQVSALFEVDL